MKTGAVVAGTIKEVPRTDVAIAKRLRRLADMIEANKILGIVVCADEGNCYRFIHDESLTQKSLALAAILQQHLLLDIFDED